MLGLSPRRTRTAIAPRVPIDRAAHASPLPPGKRWNPHQSHQERERRMRQSLRRVLKLAAIEARDPHAPHPVAACLERIRAGVADEPDPAFGALHLVHVAWIAAQDTRTTWAESATHMMDGFDKRAAVAAE